MTRELVATAAALEAYCNTYLAVGLGCSSLLLLLAVIFLVGFHSQRLPSNAHRTSGCMVTRSLQQGSAPRQYHGELPEEIQPRRGPMSLEDVNSKSKLSATRNWLYGSCLTE